MTPECSTWNIRESHGLICQMAVVQTRPRVADHSFSVECLEVFVLMPSLQPRRIAADWRSNRLNAGIWRTTVAAN